ncbi:ataxin-7-like protein 2b isoform X2 [Cynoglossus semilaevis]|uniref:ataxin-7-like protein 2b isoform X2 n=1 Tax=Cynoglossus semilaevis TaxID=244447 RepID=UPI0007DCAE97|nr:ataxin-7-like protein 2 isoform X2 [Cynoglossus semilaevis]
MAALNRRIPNLDDFVGLNWSCWVDRVNILPSDAGSDTEDGSKYGKKRTETMTLRKEDMHIFGHCPAQDDFYLVVCSHCGQVVKPEAFEKHCERRHGQLTKMCGQSSTLAPQQRPRPGQSPVKFPFSRERQRDGAHGEDRAASAASLPVHQHRPTKAQREAVSLPSVEKFPQEKPSLLHHSTSITRPRAPPWHSGPLPPGSSSNPTPERPPVQKATVGQTSESHSPLRGTKTYSRTNKNKDKKECDLNKHNRVLDPEKKKPSSLEPVCNTDALHQQQKTPTKAKPSDHLAAEQRRVSSGQQPPVKSKEKEQHVEVFDEKVTQGSRHNCHVLGANESAENLPEEKVDSPVAVEVKPPYPFNHSLLSSEESDADEQEENTDLPASTWHPKPLGLCTFGCRTLGCSIFTFDRRLHHLRIALSAMLEQHINSHLWKKMPPAASGLRSSHVTSPPVRNASKPLKSAGSLKRDCTSQGQLETKSSHHNSQSTKPPTSTSAASLESAQWCSTMRRPSKAQLKEVVLVQDGSSAVQKASRLPHSSEDKSSRYFRDSPLTEKGQQKSPSCSGSAGKKQQRHSLPLQPTKRHLPGLEKQPPLSAKTEHKVVSNDHQSPGQKRKWNNESSPVSSSLPRTSKCKRLSTSSTSSLLTWKGENIEDVLSWDQDKRSNS